MEEYLTVLKDLLIVISPIIVAYISYRSSKKTKEDIRLDIEKSLKEKDAETSQIIQKISAELESQKQLMSWNNSIPQTNEYTKMVGAERYGNISSLKNLTDNVRNYIDTQNLSTEELKEIKSMLMKVNLPLEEEHLYPYEIPYIIDYKKLLRHIDDLLSSLNSSES